MDAILTSLITQLKNPWQYICVGVVWSGILYYGIDRQYLAPSILASLGLAYLLEQILTKGILVILIRIKDYIVNKKILYTLKNCTSEEKDFLFNRVFENENELTIDMKTDNYFYKKEFATRQGNFRYIFYKKAFDTKEKVTKFLRQLENKKIIQSNGNQTMVIPQYVWKIMIRNANKIFKNFSPLSIEPTDEKLKWARILYNTMSKEHKTLLKKVMIAPSTEYSNVKVLDNVLAMQANSLKIYTLLNEFQIDFLANACIATFTPELYSILEIILEEDKIWEK